ncbi:hypothetical protein [Brevundimonas intermedia]
MSISDDGASWARGALSGAANRYGHRAWPIENGDVAGYPAQDRDAGRRNLSVAIVDHEIIRPPEAQRTDAEVTLSSDVRQGRRQVACLFLPQMIPHIDRQRQHSDKRARRRIVRQFPIQLITTAGSVEESAKANSALAPLFPLMIVLMLTVIMVQTRSFKRPSAPVTAGDPAVAKTGVVAHGAHGSLKGTFQ